ncbi:hypothetical protein ACFLY1_00010 [Patescibacteria group bacterium]
MNNKQMLKYILIAMTAIVSFFSWMSIDRAINNPGSSNWLVPIGWFLIWFILINLVVVIIKRTNIEKILLTFTFLLSFIFIFDPWHFLAIIFGLLFIFLSFKKINKDLELNIKIDLWKTLRTGRALIILSLALMITSQYYLEVKSSNATRPAPQFEIGKYSGALTSKMLARVNPQFKSLEKEDLTIDEFILQLQENQVKNNASSMSDDDLNVMIRDQFGEDVPPEIVNKMKDDFGKQTGQGSEFEELNKKVILEQSRKQFSEFAGFEIQGNERVSDIFARAIDEKINSYFRPDTGEGKYSSVVPMIFAIILFLTIVPLGNIVSLFGVMLTMVIFWIFMKTKLVSIIKIPAEKEVIE